VVVKFNKKVCLLGDEGVGKTSLIRKFVMDKFDDKYITTIGTKITKKDLSYSSQGVELTLLIWDILGQKGYTTIQSTSYKGAEGAIMVCDLTRRETLRSLEDYWLPELTKVTGKVPLVFVGNKVDLLAERQIGDPEIASFAVKYGAPHYLASARTGEHVEDLFKKLGDLVMNVSSQEGSDAGAQ